MAKTGYRIEIERPTDAEILNRNRIARISSVIFFSTLIIATPILFIGYWGSLLGHNTTGSIIGFLVGGITLANIAPRRMFVYNPEWCGYVTQDVFKGGMVPYGPGLHASHWWEQRNAEGNYSLEVKNQPFSIGVPTESGKVTFSGEYEYAKDLSLIERSIGINQSVVEKGITAFIDNFLTVRCANKKTKEIVAHEALEKLGEDLSQVLMDSGGKLAAIRNKYGYKTVGIIIDGIALPQEVQQTRNSIDEADALFEVIAKMYGRSKEDLRSQIANGTITDTQYQKMLTRAMALSDNKTNIDVKVIEGLEGSSAGAVAATLDALKGGKK